MISPDKPIQSKEEDLLKRVPLAERIAALIKGHQGSESYVIGVEAPWGAGKTSFINLVREQLDGDVVSIIDFDPWFFTSQDELIRDFFSELTKIIEKEVTGAEDEVEQVSSYVSKLTKNLEITFSSPEIKLPWWLSGSTIQFGTKKKLGGDGPATLRDARRSLESLTLQLKKKVLVIIDNIDRLDPQDALGVFKLVKLTADLPNTVFLLSYARDAVTSRLKEEGIEGDEYLKKIIQVPFTLPQPEKEELWDLLFADLNRTLKQVYGTDDLSEGEESRWGKIFRGGISELFKTIRDTKRFISSLQLNWSIVDKDDINKVDFIAIEAIRITAPEFYSAMAANKDLLTGTHRLLMGLNERDEKETKKKMYEELFSLIPDKGTRKAVSEICEELFPPLDFNVSYSDSSQEEWRREKRVCAGEKFNFYFKLGVPKGAISEGEIAALIKTLKTQSAFEQNILKFKEAGRLRNVLAKLLDYVRDLDKRKANTLILTLWNRERDIDDSPGGGLDLESIEMQTNRLAHRFTGRLPKAERVEFLSKILKKTSGISYPANLLLIAEQEAEKGRHDAILTQEGVKELTQVWARLARAAIKTGELQKAPQLAFLLFRVHRWASPEEVHPVIESLLATPEGIGTLLSSFMQKVYSSAQNYHQLDKKSFGELYEIEKITEKVNALTDKEIKRLDKRAQLAISLYKNPPKREWPFSDSEG